MNEPSYLQNLNPPQKEAVLHVDGPLLVLAGAGSGKTRVIVCRIANLIANGVRPWNILAVTFTNKAAAEMRNRVDQLVEGRGRGAWVSTFHAFCAQFLRIEAKNVGLDPNFVIYDQSDQLSIVKSTLKEMLLNEKQFPPGQIVNAISRAKDELIDAGSYGIHARTNGDPFRERVARIYESYDRQLKSANALDFGDLIMKTVEAFRDRPAVREKYQKRFRYLLVDEYQDTNHAQYLLVKYLGGQEKNVCVVGDDDQSIYSWRGASIRNILEFERDYPGAKVVKLEQNYRSTKRILDVAGKLIAHNERRKQKTLWTDNEPGDDIEFVEMMNEQEEARYVVDEICALTGRRGFEYRDIAVFYRTNAQSRVFEDALRRSTIPYTIIGALRFYERAEIKDAIAYLRVAVNPRDTVSLKRIINVPARGLGKNSLGLLEQYAASQGISLWEALEHAHAVSGISPAARNGIRNFLSMAGQFQASAAEHKAGTVVRRILEESGYWDFWAAKADDDPEAGERLDNLQELINAATDFEERTMTRDSLETGFNEEMRNAERGMRKEEEINDVSSAGPAAAHSEFLFDGLDAPAGDVPNDGPATPPSNDINDAPSSAFPVPSSALSSALDSGAAPTLARFLQEISLLTDLDEWADAGGSVTLMTVHLAKGLEFPSVFVTGLEEGLFPIGDSAFDQDELEEERRLGYVAMTRARRRLYLTCAASRRIFGSPRMNIPSRFIEEAGIKATATPSAPTRKPVSSFFDYDFNQESQEPDRSPVAPSAEPVPRLAQHAKVGMVVVHPDFGRGKIVEKEGDGTSAKVTVQFFNGLKKKLLLKYAPLEVVR